MAEQDLIAQGRRSTMATVVQKAVTPLFTFAITVMLARGLDSGEYGVYGVLQGLVKYFSLVTSLGLPFVVQRYLPHFHGKGEDGKAKRLVSRALLLRGVALAVVGVAAIVGFDSFGAFIGIEGYEREFVLFAVGAAAYLESAIVLHALNGLFLHAYAVAGQIAYTILKTVLYGIALLTGFDLESVVVVETVSYVVMLAVYLWGYRTRFSRGVTGAPLGDDTARVTRYSAYSVLNEVGTTVFDDSTDFLVISHFLGSAAVAPYFLATQVARYFGKLNVINQFQTVFTPVFFTAYADDESRLDRMFRFLVKLGLFLVLPALIGFAIVGRPALEVVFGQRYGEAYAVTAVLLAFLPVSALAVPSTLTLQSLERVDYLLYSRAFAVYNLVASILAVQRFGVIGVAMSTGSAVFLKNAFILYHAVRLGRVRIPWAGLGRLAVNSLLSGAVVLGLRPLADGLVGLVVIVLAASAAFLLACRSNPVFEAEEAALIDRVVGRRVWVF